MKTVGVYGIKNLSTGKYYVGSSVHIERRWATHRKELTSRTHTGVKLLRAWNKYGPADWEWVVLETCNSNLLLVREQFWIDKLDSHNQGYNSLPFAGQGTRGRKRSPEANAKTVATRRARGNYAHTEATKKKISDVQRGVPKGPMSEAQKRLLSKIKKEQGMPEVERERISKMAKGRVYTEEIRANMAKAHLGYIMPDGQKAKIAAAHKGKPKSLEAMAKTFKMKQDAGAYFSLKTCAKYGLPLLQPVCPACALPFTPKFSGAKTCGAPPCTLEVARRSAEKRWNKI